MIKNFNTEAQKAAASLSTTESTLSHVNEGNHLIADGVMVQATLPEKGDACVLDPDKNVVYFRGDTYNKNLLPSGWQQVGFVAWRRGRKVKVTRVLGNYQWSKYFMWKITGYSTDGESHAFSFAVKVSGVTYTCSGNYSGSTLAQVAASMNAIVKPFDFGGHSYHVYVRNGELILQHDTYNTYLGVTATGVTVTQNVGTEILATTGMPRMNGVKTGYGAIINLDRALIYFRADNSSTDYNPAADVASPRQLPVCLPAYLGTSTYQDDHCAYLRAIYGAGEDGWIKFMKDLFAIYPSSQGVFNEQVYGDSKKNTYLLAGQKVEDHDGNLVANYLAFDATAAFGFAGAKGMEAGDWCMDTIGEVLEIKKDITYPAIYQKGVGSVSVTAANADPISRIIGKMALTQVGNNSNTWGSSRYGVNVGWIYYGSVGFANGNGYYNSYQVLASVLLTLPEAE